MKGTPDIDLMRAYDTQSLFEKKGAELPPAATIAAALLGYALLRHQSSDAEKDRQRAALENEFQRQLAIQEMRVAAGYNPNEGMTRLASLAQESGIDLSDLEKEAGIGGVLGGALKAVTSIGSKLKPGWKTKATLGLGALGAGAALYKGTKGAINYLNREGAPPRYGGGPKLEYGVNEYDQPSTGTPFMS